MIYLGAQNDPEIGPLGPIFNIPPKVPQIDIYNKTDAKPLKNVWENNQRPEFWAYEAHILNTSKSTCNEHVEQYCCETGENFLRKWSNTRNLTYFGDQNGPEIGPLRPIFYTSLKVAPMSIKSKADVNPEQTFKQNIRNLNFDSFGGPKWPKYLGLWGLSFTYLQK